MSAYETVIPKISEELTSRYAVGFEGWVEKEAPNSSTARIKMKADTLEISVGAKIEANRVTVCAINPLGDVQSFDVYIDASDLKPKTSEDKETK